MHYALRLLCCVCCPVQQSCSVQSSPFILCVFVSKIRSENKFAILSILACIFCFLRGWAAEEEEKDGEEELGIFLGGVLRMEGVDVKRWLG